MTVYIVVSGEKWEGYNIRRVFNSQEDARKCAKEMAQKEASSGWYKPDSLITQNEDYHEVGIDFFAVVTKEVE